MCTLGYCHAFLLSIYYYQRSTCFGQAFRPSSGDYKTVCAPLDIVMLFCCLFIIINVLHVSGRPSAHHQEPIKLYVQPWVLSCSPAVHRWCGWLGTSSKPSTPSIQFYRLLMMGGRPARNM